MFISVHQVEIIVLFSATALAGPLYTVQVPAATQNSSLSTRDQKIGMNSGLTISFWGSADCEGSIMSLWPDVTYVRAPRFPIVI